MYTFLTLSSEEERRKGNVWPFAAAVTIFFLAEVALPNTDLVEKLLMNSTA